MITIIGRVKIQSLERFISVFATRGATVRRANGSLSAELFMEAGSDHDAVVLFDWESRDDFEAFLADPEAKAAMQESGTQGPPTFTFLEHIASFQG